LIPLKVIVYVIPQNETAASGSRYFTMIAGVTTVLLTEVSEHCDDFVNGFHFRALMWG
jgi:hypothetical protein